MGGRLRPSNNWLNAQTTTQSIAVGPYYVGATADRLAYSPGDTVVITVSVDEADGQVGAAVTGLDQLSLEASGIEHVDLVWVQPRPRADPNLPKGEHYLFRTTPCSFPVGPAAPRRFTATFVLPRGIPPTFRGTAVRFSYRATLTATLKAAPGSSGSPAPPATLQLPLRVYPNGAAAAPPPPQLQPPPLVAEAPLADPRAAKAPPGLRGMGVSEPDRASPLVGTLGAAGSHLGADPRSPADAAGAGPSAAGGDAAEEQAAAGSAARRFSVSVGDAPLVVVSLRRPAPGRCELGASVAGSLDFSGSQAAGSSARCVFVTATLEQEEVVAAPRAVSARAADGGHVLRRVLDEQSEAVADTALTGFAFTLPVEATPSFLAEAASLRWALQFEFHIVAGAPLGMAAGAGAGAAGAAQVLKWGIPLRVVAATTEDAEL